MRAPGRLTLILLGVSCFISPLFASEVGIPTSSLIPAQATGLLEKLGVHEAILTGGAVMAAPDGIPQLLQVPIQLAAFDHDDNIMHCPTKIYLRHKIEKIERAQ